MTNAIIDFLNKNRHLIFVLLIYYLLSVFTLVRWYSKNYFPVTGDEPHYLVIADGIVKHLTLEQTLPYKEEFINKKIYPAGLAPSNESPNPSNTHTYLGKNGLFNLHNIGIPIMIAIPYYFLGIFGAKLFLVLFSGISAVLYYKISYFFSKNKTFSTITSLSLIISLPLIPASNQIYPDLISGTMILFSIYYLLKNNRKRNICFQLTNIFFISVLSWLHLKYLPISFLLLIALIFKLLTNREFKWILYSSCVFLISVISLFIYNKYAFDSFFGPYQGNDILLNKSGLMAFFGLILDQSQGFLFQNPLNFIGLFFMASFVFEYTLIGLCIIIILSILLFLNGTHFNIYGGFSFVGRFEWTVSVLFLVYTIYGLNHLYKNKKVQYYISVCLSSIFQFYIFISYYFFKFPFYNKGSKNFLSDYSVFFGEFSRWLPAFYDPNTTFKNPLNYIFILLTVYIFLYRSLKSDHVKKLKHTILLLLIIYILIFGLVNRQDNTTLVWSASEMSTTNGIKQNNSIFVKSGIMKPGFVVFGPWINLGKGKYQVSIDYTADASDREMVGFWDVYETKNMAILKRGTFNGTNKKSKRFTYSFDIDKNDGNLIYEFRMYWLGNKDMIFKKVGLRKMY